MTRITLDETDLRDLFDGRSVTLPGAGGRITITLCNVELPRVALAVADAIAARRPPAVPPELPELDDPEEEDC